ncbi:MAG TPA: type VII secretion protein EccCa [Actinomycetes bacterium]
MPPQTFTFYRPARAYPRPPPVDEVVVATPPAQPATPGTGWLSQLLPLAGSAGSVGLLLLLPGRRSFLAVALVAGTVLASAAAGLWLRRGELRARRRTGARYRAHLDAVRARLDEVATVQREAAGFLLPEPERLLALAGRPARLWERRPGDGDFIRARLGRGPVPLACPVRLESGGPLADHDPELFAAAEALVAGARTLAGMPVAVDLRGLGVVAVGGQPDRTGALVRALLCHLAVLHAPDDLRILCYAPPGRAAEWEWLKWLPHARPAAREPPARACLLTSEPARLDALLDAELRPRLERLARRAGPAWMGAGGREPPDANPGGQPAQRLGKPRPHSLAGVAGPHLVVVLDGFSRRGDLARRPAVRELLAGAAQLGATVLCLAEGCEDEPAELGARLRVSPGGRLDVQEAGPHGRRLGGIVADQGGQALCEAIARRLAPLRLESRGGRATPPDEVRLLDLLGDGRVDLADAGVGWRPRPHPELLRVPLGAGAGGEPLVLDLKEAADGGMGPHGLVVGATGAGKSELLRSLVLGLALTHPPELLSFVLVDFKGGAAFAALARLPHCAGLVTNLQDEPTMVERVRAALQGELQRRQRLLRQAGDLDGIRHYQARRAAGAALPALPYLLVVVDEFGELLASHPDFLDLFVAVGRVGRSLGVQLVLASQRLDEGRVRGLEGHLRYRICLRTFTAAESLAVLGTADAYHLPASPGLAWLKVDSTAYHRFRAALVGAPPRRPEPGAPAIVPFDPLGAAARRPARVAGARHPPGPDGGGRAAELVQEGGAGTVVVAAPGAGGGDAPTGPASDMEAAVAALAAEGARTGRGVHQVWLPPLPAVVTLDQVLGGVGPATPGAAGWLRVPVGVLDRPLAQAQEPLLLDFSAAAGHLAVVGAPRSGKSTLLCTLIAGLALSHRPEDVQVYAIDLGGGLLHQLGRLPHLGAVCATGEADRARRLVRELRGLVAEREAEFRRDGLDGIAAWHRHRAGVGGSGGLKSEAGAQEVGGHAQPSGSPPVDRASGYGEVFLVVDNWARLRRLGDDLEAGIGELVAGGLHYGVHVVVTANRWADLRLAMRDDVGGRLELRLNDPVESEVGSAAAAALPALPGRGLTAAGLQFQAALPRVAATTGLDAAGALTAAAVAGRPAPPLRLLPTLVRPDELPRPAPGQPPGVPFALDEQRLAPVWLDLFGRWPHFLVLGDGGCGKTGLLRLLARGLSERYPPDQVELLLVDYRRSLADLADGPRVAGYACDGGLAADLVGRLGALLAERLSAATPASGRLAAGHRRAGPHQVLLVDDYDLTLGLAGSPLAPLADMLGRGRELGFHLVLARPVSGTARTSFEPLFQRVRELGTAGLVLRGDPQEGPVLGGRRAGPQPPGRGHLVRPGEEDVLVQVAWAPPPGGADDPLPAAARVRGSRRRLPAPRLDHR